MTTILENAIRSNPVCGMLDANQIMICVFFCAIYI